MRLWSAAATDEFDLEEFNAGSYLDAVASKNEAENITMVLYPNATTESGQELRLRQQYFLASASLQDTLRYWNYHNDGSLDGFADKNCFQLNDTHPAIAVAELMRILIDDYDLGWDEAWDMTREYDGLYESHAASRSARDVARLDVPATAAAAAGYHLRDQRALSSRKLTSAGPATRTAYITCP